MSIKTKTTKVLKEINAEKIIKMFQQFDKNFVKLATNQIYMQENQVEFESYLKEIISNQKKILDKIK